MGGSFETSPEHAQALLHPLRVSIRADEIYSQARDMVQDLGGWSLVSADDESLTLVCERRAGLLGAPSTITIRVEGPEGIPSATVHLRSQTEGGLFSRDKANLVEFLRPFQRRVC